MTFVDTRDHSPASTANVTTYTYIACTTLLHLWHDKSQTMLLPTMLAVALQSVDASYKTECVLIHDTCSDWLQVQGVAKFVANRNLPPSLKEDISRHLEGSQLIRNDQGEEDVFSRLSHTLQVRMPPEHSCIHGCSTSYAMYRYLL